MEYLIGKVRILKAKINKFGPQKIFRTEKRIEEKKGERIIFIGLVMAIIFAVFIFAQINNFIFPFYAARYEISLNEQAIEDLFVSPVGSFQTESPEILLVQENSLIGSSPPGVITPQILGLLTGKGQGPRTRQGIKEYIVEPGDSLSAIAAKFEISLNTLLWANNLNRKSTIKSGQKLLILPVSGILHHVRAGDTLSGIAEKYQADMNKIAAFNQLADKQDIFIGDILIIPDGKMPRKKIADRRSQIPLASTFFIRPTTGRISQGLHYYNAIDFANQCGTPIWAAAQGKVQRVGYNRWLGKYVQILHPNKVVTVYGHFSKILVSPGDQVSQGTIIGRMGHTGRTIPAGPAGCHLHFEVRGARNPFAQ